VRKAAKMHQFGHQARENAAIKRIVVFDHDVTAMAPLNISCRDSIPTHALAVGSGGFLVATAQQGSETRDLILPSACQWFARFGTIGRSFSKDLRRFRWQAQKA
jgi:hypothetical protein